jgi:hypothetical protein
MKKKTRLHKRTALDSSLDSNCEQVDKEGKDLEQKVKRFRMR